MSFFFTCVSDAPDVEKVLFSSGGVVEYAKKSSLIIDFSTIGTKASKSLGHRLKQIGLRFLDAPVSGGETGAKNGSLTIMVGGADQDFSDSLPILKVLGKNIHHCGPVGSGQAVKLVNQILCGIHMVALSEAMRLAEIQEIDPSLIVEICSTGAAGSWALSNLGPNMIQSDYSAGFKVKDMLKDLRLVNEELSGQEILSGVQLAQKLFELAITTFPQGQGFEQDYVQALKWFHLAGVNGNAIGRRNADIVEQKMTPGQVGVAVGLAREWMEKLR